MPKFSKINTYIFLSKLIPVLLLVLFLGALMETCQRKKAPVNEPQKEENNQTEDKPLDRDLFILFLKLYFLNSPRVNNIDSSFAPKNFEKWLNNSCLGFWKINEEIKVESCDSHTKFTTAFHPNLIVKKLKEDGINIENFFCWGSGCVNVFLINGICKSPTSISFDPSCNADPFLSFPKYRVEELINKLDSLSYSPIDLRACN